LLHRTDSYAQLSVPSAKLAETCRKLPQVSLLANSRTMRLMRLDVLHGMES
jgi:hypothetical protein